LAGNNYPTITQLKENIWKMAFQDSLFDPSFLLAAIAYLEIATDIWGKAAAGFETTLTDPWGRLLSYMFLSGSDDGVSTTLSSVTELSNFTSHSVPFPIITALGTKAWEGEYSPGWSAITYEFTPFEFGSWDSDVSAFTPTHYLGTSMKAGVPTGSCTTNYDNLGYILGTSSNHFNEVCSNSPALGNSFGDLADRLATVIQKAATSGLYATYRNPFYQYASSTATLNIANNVSAQEHLSLVDDGETFQNNPIFPLLVPAQNVSVILINDNSANTRNFPNGSELLTTYVQSFNHGYTRMPLVPSVETFISEGLNKRATFFGCNDQSKVTIVYLPNNNYTFASNTGTFQLEYPEWETDAMIANGVGIATQGEKGGWGTCLACALMMKTENTLPSDCTACLAEYCYYGS
jgi:lysophospholipase